MAGGAGEVAVGRIGEVEDVERPDDQSIAARADDVEGLDAGHLVVGEGGEVDRLAIAGENQPVGPGAAVDGPEGEVGER